MPLVKGSRIYIFLDKNGPYMYHGRPASLRRYYKDYGLVDDTPNEGDVVCDLTDTSAKSILTYRWRQETEYENPNFQDHLIFRRSVQLVRGSHLYVIYDKNGAYRYQGAAVSLKRYFRGIGLIHDQPLDKDLVFGPYTATSKSVKVFQWDGDLEQGQNEIDQNLRFLHFSHIRPGTLNKG